MAEMNYKEAIKTLAKHHMTPEGFELLLLIEGNMPDIWDKSSSSTGKYHKKADGSVPTIAHHTYEMLYAAVKIIRMFGGKLVSVQNDVYILAVILHDRQKYGKKGTNPHTTKNHDQTMADLLEKNRKVLRKHFSDFQTEMLCTGVRYHNGRWSKDVPKMNDFSFDGYNHIVMFISMLDMLSTVDCLQFPHVEAR